MLKNPKTSLRFCGCYKIFTEPVTLGFSFDVPESVIALSAAFFSIDVEVLQFVINGEAKQTEG